MFNTPAVDKSKLTGVVKKDKKWLDKGWTVDEVYRTIDELKRKTSQELIPLFLESGNNQRLNLALNVTNLVRTLEIFTKKMRF